MELGDLTLEHFRAIVGDVVLIETEDEPVEVEVASADPVPGRPDDGDFSVLFRGASTAPLHQATYLVDLGELGPQQLFIVPIGHDQHGYTYEAVFTRRGNET